VNLTGLDNLNHPHLRSLAFEVQEYEARVRKVQVEMANKFHPSRIPIISPDGYSNLS